MPAFGKPVKCSRGLRLLSDRGWSAGRGRAQYECECQSTCLITMLSDSMALVV